MKWVRHHLGLLGFTAGFIVELILLATGKMSKGLFVLIFPAALIAGQAVDAWDRLTEIVLQPWKDIKLAFTIKERADFVAAKADEVEGLEKAMREAMIKFTEISYLTLSTKGLFPPPDFILNRISEALEYVSHAAFKDVALRNTWLMELNGLINRAHNPPKPEQQ